VKFVRFVMKRFVAFPHFVDSTFFRT
jgi:hypothetical protein